MGWNDTEEEYYRPEADSSSPIITKVIHILRDRESTSPKRNPCADSPEARFHRQVSVREPHFWVDCEDVCMCLPAPYIHVRDVVIMVNLLLLCTGGVRTVVLVPYCEDRVVFHRVLESKPLLFVDWCHDGVKEIQPATCPEPPADAS